MGFGHELWDKTDKVDQYMEEGLLLMNDISEFFRKLISIESEYSKGMGKLIQSHSETLQQTHHGSQNKSSLLHAWNALLDDMGHVACAHKLVAEKLQTETVEELKRVYKEKEQDRKNLLKDMHNCQDELKKHEKIANQYKGNYEKRAKEADEAKRDYDKANKDETMTRTQIHKTKDQLDVKIDKLKESEVEFKSFIDIFNEKHGTYYREQLPQILDALQIIEEDRIEHLKEVFIALATYGGNIVPVLKQSFESIERFAKSIDKDADIRNFIETHQSGRPLPFGYTFKEYAGVEDTSKSSIFAPIHSLLRRKPSTREDQAKFSDTISSSGLAQNKQIIENSEIQHDQEMMSENRNELSVSSEVNQNNSQDDSKNVQKTMSTFDDKEISGLGLKMGSIKEKSQELVEASSSLINTFQPQEREPYKSLDRGLVIEESHVFHPPPIDINVMQMLTKTKTLLDVCPSNETERSLSIGDEVAIDRKVDIC